jgi:hypothetical protein
LRPDCALPSKAVVLEYGGGMFEIV